jgi:TonB family protein
MLHGIQAHFEERARNGRRVSLIAVALGLVFLGALSLARVPPIERTLRRTALRFGFEGPDQYVHRILLQPPPGKAQTLRNVGRVIERSSERGGSPNPRSSKSPRALPESRPRISGPGDALDELLARAYARRSDVPIVQSTELVIEVLVRPVYPEHARDNNIEGRVAVMALVDTGGRVVEVEVLEGSAAEELRQAATEAVWRCRFRPYRVSGAVHDVYALFRFNFTIY